VLWYKVWLETRGRFLISLVGITAICCLYVFHEDGQALSYTKMSYYYVVLYAGHGSLVGFWVLAVTLLAMGGLVREKAVGASFFTLALPVSRARLAGVRIGIILLEAITLGIVPWTAMFVVACVAGKPLALEQAGFYLVLLVGAGVTFFAIAILVSSLVEGEYTAPVVAFGVIISLAFLFDVSTLRPYSLWRLIMGSDLVDRKTYLLLGPIPWLQMAGSLTIAGALLLISVRAIQRREF
jgi:ABC-2 type transport system permease protein